MMGYLRFLTVFVLSLGVVAHSGEAEHAAGQAGKPGMEVFKSPTCGCCTKWVEHAQSAGFEVAVNHPADLDRIKADHGIASHYQSCHTAVTKEGFVFEGHIPARYIQEFLSNLPENARGLAVPGMPAGSPGMEMGRRFSPYRIFVLKTDGSREVFREVSSAGEQYR